ncbi:Fur family transcriptional regulator [Acetobacterium woodii]|uniref:Ferric uptake regulation protein Fur2 n=1 Tax=Acetobacterium woodii (strain ATCC 29683 / DSM 1030 / JCM 2381 / KCTC 1655 / WB1) TaxID=931626 RepID=H6LDX8_ACEWD|nr:Fur family transcriptional regulator [Acetobacterium woodii]AFA48021.1 ferric uptake regulation protein Fur2 [Acetobacterium woodii DSM 1030]
MKKPDIQENLKKKGLKSTKHRMAILDILVKKDHPIAAEQIFLEMQKMAISINLSTVYRNLEVLAEKNLVTKLALSGDDRYVYEYNRMIHRHYLICLGCKKILALEDCPIKGYEQQIESETDYQIVGHKLDLYGYCPSCRKNNS